MRLRLAALIAIIGAAMCSAAAEPALVCPPYCVAPPKRAPAVVMPECKSEQLSPPKFIVDFGPPDQRSALSLANSLKAGYIDVGAYRGTHTGLRVELCEASTLLARGEREKAQAHLEEARSYLAAIIDANKAVQIKAELERKSCLDGLDGAFSTVQQFEEKGSEAGKAAWTAYQTYQNLDKLRGQWDGEIERTRAEIRRDIDDYNGMVSKPFYEIRALFTGSQDRDNLDRQLKQLQQNLDSYNKQKGQMTEKEVENEIAAHNGWARQRAAFQQVQEARKKLGIVLSTISAIATNTDTVAEMDRSFSPLTTKLEQLPRWINYAPDELRKTIDDVRASIKERVEVFPRVADLGCRAGTFTAGMGPQW